MHVCCPAAYLSKLSTTDSSTPTERTTSQNRWSPTFEQRFGSRLPNVLQGHSEAKHAVCLLRFTANDASGAHGIADMLLAARTERPQPLCNHHGLWMSSPAWRCGRIVALLICRLKASENGMMGELCAQASGEINRGLDSSSSSSNRYVAGLMMMLIVVCAHNHCPTRQSGLHRATTLAQRATHPAGRIVGRSRLMRAKQDTHAAGRGKRKAEEASAEF